MLKTEAITLSCMRYGETSHIVQLFTREQGLVSCLIKGGRRGSTVSPILLQPFSVFNAVVDSKPTRQFQYVRESSPALILDSIATNPMKNAVAFFLCEILSHVLRGENYDERLYEFVRFSIEKFNALEKNYANFHLVFLIKMSYFLGFFPNLSDFHAGVLFDLVNSQFVDVAQNTHTLDVQQTEIFAQLMRLDYDTMRVFVMSGPQRSEVLEQILIYYRLHLNNFGQIKSLEVLRQLFA